MLFGNSIAHFQSKMIEALQCVGDLETAGLSWHEEQRAGSISSLAHTILNNTPTGCKSFVII